MPNPNISKINVRMNIRAVRNYLRWLDKQVTAGRVNQFTVTKEFPNIEADNAGIIFSEKVDIAISFVPTIYKASHQKPKGGGNRKQPK